MNERFSKRRAEILELRETLSLAEIAARYGISKQRVAQILKWKPSNQRRGIRNQPRRGPHIQTQNLSKRQAQIAGLVAKGLHNIEIANRLGITVGTVKIHVHNIYNKQNVDSRTQLAIKHLEGKIR
jgi:DNA-binding NarL/FixJ family response regulator